ncbi:hypothetical protein D3C87_1411770 [compost metagenome]
MSPPHPATCFAIKMTHSRLQAMIPMKGASRPKGINNIAASPAGITRKLMIGMAARFAASP